MTYHSVSSLLLCSSLFGSDEIKLEFEGEIASNSHTNMTLALMKKFGASVSIDAHFITVKSNCYKEIEEYCIEGDFSYALYDIAISALYGQPIELLNIPIDSIQSEINFLSILSTYFKGFKIEENGSLIIQGTLLNQTYDIECNEISLHKCSDSFVILSIIIAVKLPKGTLVKITGIGDQKLKKCNRIEKCVEILNSLRIISYELPDGIAIISNPTVIDFISLHYLNSCTRLSCSEETTNKNSDESKTLCNTAKKSHLLSKIKCSSVFIPTFEDHRLAMAFTLLGSTFCKQNKVVVQNGRIVDNAFPEFWNHINTNYGICYSGYVQNLKENRANFCGNQNLLILIGMKNSGKSMYARHLCEHEDFQEYSIDKIVEKHSLIPISAYVSEHGWDEYRKLETQIFFEILFKVYCDFDSHLQKQKIVISTG